MEGLRPWPPLCELRKRCESKIWWGDTGGLNPERGLIQECSHTPGASEHRGDLLEQGDLSRRGDAWERQVKNKKSGSSQSACHLGLFYFQSLSLYKPISCRAAPSRYIVGFGISFLDMGAGEQSRGGVDVRLSSISAGRAERPWFTFRRSRDTVEAAKLEGPAESS